jgi:5-methyltetrahydropteroyltriglutamate--homocysteine methyltransferase
MSQDNKSFFFDDIGSYPLPKGVVINSLSNDQYLELVRETLVKKIDAGVEVPTYPQFRDMIRMFLDPIVDPENIESPYLIKGDCAEIIELRSVPPREKVRVCVTGPIELYLSVYGSTSYTDILYNMAESVARYLKRAIDSGKTSVASIDEPSLGISSAIVFEEDEILKALEIASEPCKEIDCEIHLHSPLYAQNCAHVPGINIIGVESAAHPDYLRLIDREMLEETDTYLRAGIARTDILSIAASLNDRLGINIWDDPAKLHREVLAMESKEVILKRLEFAYKSFGDRLRAVGPDCGLGSWPNQSMASELLSNCGKAVRSMRQNL